MWASMCKNRVFCYFCYFIAACRLKVFSFVEFLLLQNTYSRHICLFSFILHKLTFKFDCIWLTELKLFFFFARFSTHETSPYVIYMCVRACGDLNFYFLFVDLFVFVTSCDWIFHAYISKIDSQFQYTFWLIFECIEIHCIKFNSRFDVRPNKFTFIKWNKSMQFAIDKLKRIKVQLGWNEIRCEKFIVLKFCSKWRESESVCMKNVNECVYKQNRWINFEFVY